MWTTTERDAWLGPARDTMTDDQLDRFDAITAIIEDRWPADPDDPDANADRLSGALQIILGEATLESLGADRHRAQTALVRASQTLQGAMAVCADLGPSEVTRRAGVARNTAREALGLTEG